MDAQTVAFNTANEKGWTDETLLDVVLEYINNQQDNDAFASFLADKD